MMSRTFQLAVGLTVLSFAASSGMAQVANPPAASQDGAGSSQIPVPDALPVPPTAGQGLERDSASPNERPRMGVMLGQSAGAGVLITDVAPGSPAFNAGLRRGDYIISVGDQKVSDPNTVSDVVAEETKDDRVALVIWRDARAQDWEVDFRNTGPPDGVQPQQNAAPSDYGYYSNNYRNGPYYRDSYRPGYSAYPYYGTAGPRDYFYNPGRYGFYNNRNSGFPGTYGYGPFDRGFYGSGLYIGPGGGGVRINGFGFNW